MARGKNLPASKEEKMAIKIGSQVADYTLDLEAVGWYLAKATPFVVFNRALTVLESAQFHKEEMEKNKNGFYTNHYDF